MNRFQKNLWAIILVIVILAGGIFLAVHQVRVNRAAYLAAEQNGAQSLSGNGVAAGEQQNPGTSSSQSSSGSGTSTPASVFLGHNGLSYTAAVNKYANRIQFTGCNASAGLATNGIMAIKAGQYFMIDNRGSKSHVFAFRGFRATIRGYDFAVVAADIKGTYPLTCDGGGAAQLNIN